MSEPTNAQATPAQNEPATTEPEFVTKDEFRTIVSGMLKSMLPKVVQESVAPAIEKQFADLQSKIAVANAAPQSAPATTEPVSDKKKDAPNPEIVALQKQLAELQKQSKEAQDRYVKERLRSQENKALADLRQLLNGKVKPEAVDLVTDLIRGRGQIQYDEDGNAQMRVTVSQKGFDDEEQVLPLASAIPHFLKSKEASFFIPPPSAGAGAPKPKMPNARQPNGQFANGAPKSPSDYFESLGFGSLEDHL